MSNAQVLAQRLLTARRDCVALERFPADIPESLGEAYAVQDAAMAMEARQLAGWKLAYIRPELHSLHGERLSGPIFVDQAVLARAGTVADIPIFAGGFAGTETEFAVVLSQALAPGRGAAVTREQARAAAGRLHIAIEILSSPVPGLLELGPMALASDQGGNNGAIIGPEITDWRTRSDGSLSTYTSLNGARLGTGSAASIPGGPFAAVAFLANDLAARGRSLPAGSIILAGNTTGFHPVAPGDRLTAGCTGAGVIEASVSAIRPTTPLQGA